MISSIAAKKSADAAAAAAVAAKKSPTAASIDVAEKLAAVAEDSMAVAISDGKELWAVSQNDCPTTECTNVAYAGRLIGAYITDVQQHNTVTPPICGLE